MPRLTIIKKVVNALQLQDRMILNLECGHNIGVSALRFMHEPNLHFEEGDEYICPYCEALPKAEDPPPTPPQARDAFDALFGDKS